MSKSVPEEQRLDLRLDNKWGPEDGHPLPFVRRNPIVFALSPPGPPTGDCGDAVSGEASGEGSGGDEGVGTVADDIDKFARHHHCLHATEGVAPPLLQLTASANWRGGGVGGCGDGFCTELQCPR